ncbi:MAG: PQQ-dependent dehydrogenase, methanol/ethanol family [Pseudomonadales bacterium]|jgi:PQQ-dependent dehydrogenase (methanol/ethanol family)|nr:PQQ-dependent dehydrogenase, methanol/ethanol family [Pseudomonadales bacterium]
MRTTRTGTKTLALSLLVLSICQQNALQAATVDTATPVTPSANGAARGPAAVDTARLLAADAEPGQWMSTGRTYGEQHYSPLNAIDRGNVATLGLAWYADFNIARGQESTPLVIDGVIYVTTAWSNVLAFDAVTGAPLWSFDSKVPRDWGSRACCDVVNRGAAAWNGKIYVGTIDGRLIALDAATGTPVWSTDTVLTRDLSYSITGAPRVVKGKVIIGNGGAEYGVRGYVSAYDAETGALDWRFFTVPGNPAEGFENDTMRMAAETWKGEWWKLGGGGTAWDGMAYDPELDLLYIGVGNGSPWNQDIRSPGGGDNLFLSSIVALNPDDGSYVWHYQTTPGETWDYTATQPIMVATLPINGAPRKVVMQAPKNGFFYVLDAATGAFISAKPFAALNWATGIDEKGRPIENPVTRFDRTGKAAVVQPGPGGSHNWQPMAYSPQTGLVYLPATDSASIYAYDRNFNPNPLTTNLGIDNAAGAAELGPNAMADFASGSYMVAWNPVTQQASWRIPGPSAGMLATAGGLVFKGDQTGLGAYDAASGAQLWHSTPTHTGVAAAPVTYTVNGEQYVAVVAGRSNGNYYAPDYSRLLVFKQGAAQVLPEPVSYTPPTLNPPQATASIEQVARGAEIYGHNCWICHGDVGSAGGPLRRGLFPELAVSPTLNSQELFDAVVLQGVRSANGMVSFANVVNADGAADLRAYLIERANAALNARRGP